MTTTRLPTTASAGLTGRGRMRLTDLTIRDFRNLAALDFELPETGVVIIGANGQGKTNLLEAIYYLVLFRSFRRANDRELVRFGQPGFFVAGRARVRVTAGYEITGQRKKVAVDGVAARRLGEAVGRVSAVSFGPADREMVAGGPAERRRYLDVLLSLSDPTYLRALGAMRAALRQRNAALRQGHRSAAQAFDAPLAEAATAVLAARRCWVDRWAARFAELCAALGEPAPCRMEYRHHVTDPERGAGDLRSALGAAIDRDLRRGMTTVGPHRDDLRLAVGDRGLRRYGSAGQHRTAAVALRLLEAEALTAVTGEPPIGLYDDVFAELDEDRQARLLGLIQDVLPGQAIITAPRDSEVPRDMYQRERWSMRGGRIGR